MQEKLRTFIGGYIDGFPSLPAVVTRVMELTASTDSSIDDLLGVISADQALTVNVLKMANSIFYGLPKRVGSLQHALSLLGYVEIRNMVITQAMFNNFKHINPKGAIDLNRFWSHAFTCAVATKLVAKHAGCSADDLYIACLIHDIGKLVIAMALPDAYAVMVRETGAGRAFAMHEVEARFLKMTHADIAGRVLKQWMLPEHLIQAVCFHHSPDQAGEHSDYVWGVHATDLLVHWSDAEQAREETAQAALEQMLLRPELVEALGGHTGCWNKALLLQYRQDVLDLKRAQADMLTLFAA